MSVIKSLKAKRPRNIPANKIRKHSDIVGSQEKHTYMNEERVVTPTGFRSVGTENRSFSTYYEYMMPHQVTDLLFHEKKEKTIRVLSGYGFLTTVENVKEEASLQKSETNKILAGDFIVLKANVAYSISSSIAMEFIVVEEARYTARLETINRTGTTATVSQELLVATDRDSITAALESFPGRRGTSKAALQQSLRQDEIDRRRGLVVSRQGAPVTHGSPSAEGINASPMTDFSDY